MLGNPSVIAPFWRTSEKNVDLDVDTFMLWCHHNLLVIPKVPSIKRARLGVELEHNTLRLQHAGRLRSLVQTDKWSSPSLVSIAFIIPSSVCRPTPRPSPDVHRTQTDMGSSAGKRGDGGVAPVFCTLHGCAFQAVISLLSFRTQTTLRRRSQRE